MISLFLCLFGLHKRGYRGGAVPWFCVRCGMPLKPERDWFDKWAGVK